MQGRKGIYINVDTMLDALRDKSFEETKRRNPERGDEWVDSVADVLAVAAFRFELVKQDPDKIIAFDMESSLRLQGDTGPYLLYSYARASRILAKSGATDPKVTEETAGKLTHPKEVALLKLISVYDKSVLEAEHVSFAKGGGHVRPLPRGDLQRVLRGGPGQQRARPRPPGREARDDPSVQGDPQGRADALGHRGSRRDLSERVLAARFDLSERSVPVQRLIFICRGFLILAMYPPQRIITNMSRQHVDQAIEELEQSIEVDRTEIGHYQILEEMLSAASLKAVGGGKAPMGLDLALRERQQARGALQGLRQLEYDEINKKQEVLSFFTRLRAYVT